MNDVEQLPPARSAPLPTAPKRRRWVSWLLSAVIFASGFLVGGGATLLFLRNRAIDRWKHPQEAASQDAARLQRLLGLSDQQRAQVEKVLLARQASIRRGVVAELDGLEKDVSDLLDPAQKHAWHDICSRLRNTWLQPPPQNRQRR